MKQKIIIIIGVCIVAFASYALFITSNHNPKALYGLSERSQPNHQFSHRNFQSGKQTTFQDFDTPLSKQTMVGDQPQVLTNSPTQRMTQRTSKRVSRSISPGQITQTRKSSTSILSTQHVAKNNGQVMPSSTSLGSSSSSNSHTSTSQTNSAQNISFASNISALNTLSNGEIYAQYTTANVPVQYAMADVNPGSDNNMNLIPLNASTKVLLLFIALYGLVIWRKSEKRETVR